MLLLESDFFEGQSKVVWVRGYLVPGVVVEDFGRVGEVAATKDGGALDYRIAAVGRRGGCGGIQLDRSGGVGMRGEGEVVRGHY